jgi:hypothetical protein
MLTNSFSIRLKDFAFCRLPESQCAQITMELAATERIRDQSRGVRLPKADIDENPHSVKKFPENCVREKQKENFTSDFCENVHNERVV